MHRKGQLSYSNFKVEADLALSSILNDLRIKLDDKEKSAAAKNLQSYVLAQSREMSTENFKRWFIALLKTHIYNLIMSPNNDEKIGGLMAVDELIEVANDEGLSVLVRYLHFGLATGDPQVMTLAAKALGHLSLGNTTIIADCVEFEMKSALEWLQGERNESKRHAACLVLKELGVNTPTRFYPHLPTFFDLVWVGLRDPKPAIRECAAESLAASLKLIADRESRFKLQWHQKIFEEAFKGFNKQNNPEQIHASLLTLGKLLETSADLKEKFGEICKTVLKYKENRDKIIRRTVITLLPKLAAYSPEKFIQNYLNESLTHLLGFLKRDIERPACFDALAEIVTVAHPSIGSYIDGAISMIKLGLSVRGKQQTLHFPEALFAISNLAKYRPKDVEGYMPELLDLMFAGPLSQPLTESLALLAQCIPHLAEEIQERLLDMISLILAHKNFNYPGAPSKSSKRAPAPAVVLSQDEQEKNIAMALSTLGSFNFGEFILIDFLSECVVNYLNHSNLIIRKEAVICCGKLMGSSKANMANLTGSEEIARHYYGVLLCDLVEKLLGVAVSDPEKGIRLTVLTCLDWRFDQYLAQPQNLNWLFICLNDEAFEIREVSLNIVSRLAALNPAYVLPSLRTTLTHFLVDLDFSGDNLTKEESSKLLGILIRTVPALVKPYAQRIMKALLSKLREPDSGVSSSALSTLGELAVVNGKDMIPYLNDLFPLIIDTLQDQSSSSKREVAVRTLGQLVSSSGHVIQPYISYPKLLDTILNLIQSETNVSIRREVIKVFGILGALDPYRYKMNQLLLEGRQDDVEGTGRTQKSSSETSEESFVQNLSPSSEDYYPTITIAALMRILRDPTLSAHHTTVIYALMLIVKSLGMKSIQFLPLIMPPFLQVMGTCEPEFRTILFQQLGQLVARVKQHIRPYLGSIFPLVREYWNTPNLMIHIVTLLEEISTALSDEFKPYLAELLPMILPVLNNDPDENRLISSKILHAIEVFGSNLDDYLNLLVPVVVKVCEQADSPQRLSIEALQSLTILARNFNISSYTSRIVQCISRILDAPEALGKAEIKKEAMKALTVIASQLGSSFMVFNPLIQKVLAKHHLVFIDYDNLLLRLKDDLPTDLDNTGDPETNSRTSDIDDEDPMKDSLRKIKLNDQNLRRAWEVSGRHTKEDWYDWMKKFSVELLKESPSPALRSCISLANDYQPIVKELFNAAFVSCWTELTDNYQDELVRSLETALLSPTIPPEILQTLLNLAEFMEQDEKPLPIDPRTLGALAEKCNAYAKALHYKEMEFRVSPISTIEALISINNQLAQPEAATGILTYAQKYHNIELKESWHEKLQQYADALEAYNKKQQEDPLNLSLALGRMRCLNELGEWEQLSSLCQEIWDNPRDSKKLKELESKDSNPSSSSSEIPGSAEWVRKRVAPLGAAAAWNLSNWDAMHKYVKEMDKYSIEGGFYRAILAIHSDSNEKAQKYIALTRQVADAELPALVGESYNRAYKLVVRLQHLAELEEIVLYKNADKKTNKEVKDRILKIWKDRLEGCERSIETWQNVLAVRSLVLSPIENLDSYLKFSALCRKSGRKDLSRKTLVTLLGGDPEQYAQNASVINFTGEHPRVSFAYIKYMWTNNAHKIAFNSLKKFAPSVRDDSSLQARIYLKLGQWHSTVSQWDEGTISQVIANFHQAIKFDISWSKAWHSWALANYNAIPYFEKMERVDKDVKEGKESKRIVGLVVCAINGFLRAISLAPDISLQDTLRVLTLWFKYAMHKDVETALTDGFATVAIDTWLQVIPQIIARIHATQPNVRRLIHDLLTTIGKHHPQALAYPLTVSSKSGLVNRAQAAIQLMDKMNKHSGKLLEQAQLVSEELIRVSILWHEMWHEGLEEASRTYFGDHNTDAMMATLKPLHEMLDKGAETTREQSFHQAYGRDLQEAYEWCKKWERSKKTADVNQAWDLYYKVFRKIAKQLPQLTTLELQHVSPKLLTARDLQLAVPGTYKAGHPIIRISSFVPTLNVISSKQRPRKLIINGSDGAEYMFLLKGHEDLRQDERVMQLFGLVNTLLASEYETSKNHLNIQRYSVIPLSPNSGLIGWVPHCDTMHQLIRDYRDSRKILINIEHRLMLQMAPDYDNLPVINKVEAFQYALDSTNGQDLEKILWLKSSNSEVWLDRRTNYTRSLAVMSMVGYILGLGDRHPSNLMLDRHTGKVLHIDFGDCFEVAMQREKYPEKIPFRLTRMLINAMEVSGIEGTFRLTCQNVMNVLRENKESLMAVLEAFVYDPIINWRLIMSPDMTKTTTSNNSEETAEASESFPIPTVNSSNANSDLPDLLNKRAIHVIQRVNKKLTGKDFPNSPAEGLDIAEQVQRLINQATSHENLCQCYIGWCPFW